MKRCLLPLIVLLVMLLAGCGPTRHVFPPDISVQQLHVDADGQWTLTLRMQNYSYDASVHFDRIHGQLQVADQLAAKIATSPDMDIAQQSSDVIHVTVNPSLAARDALSAAAKASTTQVVRYMLTGKVLVTAEDGGQRSFPVDHNGWLSPVPGVANTYR